MKKLSIVILFLLVGMIAGCTPNQPPIIQNLNLEKEIIYIGEEVEIWCTASDSEGDQLTYQWNVSNGQISGSGLKVKWIAPKVVGVVTIEVVVSDGKNSVSDKVDIQVIDNHSPVVELTATSTSVNLGERVNIAVSAFDSDGDNLTYRWQVSGGSFETKEDATTISWYANQDGNYEISVFVDDGIEEVESTIAIEVINLPMTIEINCEQRVVVAGETLVFDIIVNDDLPSTVEIQEVQASAGILTLLSNKGSSACYSWTAPFKPWNLLYQYNSLGS